MGSRQTEAHLTHDLSTDSCQDVIQMCPFIHSVSASDVFTHAGSLLYGLGDGWHQDSVQDEEEEKSSVMTASAITSIQTAS